jgi:hypothetical protein
MRSLAALRSTLRDACAGAAGEDRTITIHSTVNRIQTAGLVFGKSRSFVLFGKEHMITSLQM